MGDRYDAAYDPKLAPQATGDAIPSAKVMAAYDQLPKIVREELGHAILPYNVHEFLQAYQRDHWSEIDLVEQLWGADQRNHERLLQIIPDWPRQEVNRPVKASAYISQTTRAARRLQDVMAKRLNRRQKLISSAENRTSPQLSRSSDAARLAHTPVPTLPKPEQSPAEPEST